MRGCFFTLDGKYIYSLATEMKCKSYMIKWKCNKTWDSVSAEVVNKQPSTGMKLSENGDYIGLMTSDGFIKVMN